MALTLRFTAPSSDDRDWLDYTIVEDGRRDVGRLYEDRHSRPELRWFWSITVYINPNLGITTTGRAPTMNEAKEHSFSPSRPLAGGGGCASHAPCGDSPRIALRS
jgi:hypothetical protein